MGSCWRPISNPICIFHCIYPSKVLRRFPWFFPLELSVRLRMQLHAPNLQRYLLQPGLDSSLQTSRPGIDEGATLYSRLCISNDAHLRRPGYSSTSSLVHGIFKRINLIRADFICLCLSWSDPPASFIKGGWGLSMVSSFSITPTIFLGYRLVANDDGALSRTGRGEYYPSEYLGRYYARPSPPP